MKSYIQYSCGHIVDSPAKPQPQQTFVPYPCAKCVELDMAKAAERIYRRFENLGLPQLTGPSESTIALAERIRGDFAACALELRELQRIDAYQRVEYLLLNTTSASQWLMLDDVDLDMLFL